MMVFAQNKRNIKVQLQFAFEHHVNSRVVGHPLEEDGSTKHFAINLHCGVVCGQDWLVLS